MKFSWEIVRLILLDYEYSDIDKTNDKTLENSLKTGGRFMKNSAKYLIISGPITKHF
jgi:hypothetical protein